MLPRLVLPLAYFFSPFLSIICLKQSETFKSRFSIYNAITRNLDDEGLVYFGCLQVGRGLSKNAKALKLAFQHWIEAVRT